MPGKINKRLQDGLNRLKKVLKRALAPQKAGVPQLILQPYRNKQKFDR